MVPGGDYVPCEHARASAEIRHAPRRQDPHRARGGRVSAPGRASAQPHRRAEHRHDESRRLLPQLPVQLDEGRGRRQGRADEQGSKPRGDLRHAVRGMEGQVPEGSLGRAEGRVRKGKPETLIVQSYCPPLWMAAWTKSYRLDPNGRLPVLSDASVAHVAWTKGSHRWRPLPPKKMNRISPRPGSRRTISRPSWSGSSGWKKRRRRSRTTFATSTARRSRWASTSRRCAPLS